MGEEEQQIEFPEYLDFARSTDSSCSLRSLENESTAPPNLNDLIKPSKKRSKSEIEFRKMQLKYTNLIMADPV